MMWWNDYGTAPWMLFGPMFFILIMAACAVMMFFMMRGHGHGRRSGAAQILSERFARGEIDKAEYEERRHTLGA